MNDREKMAVSLMADCDMNTSEVARRMECGRTSVLWYLDKVQEKTGLDARCFYDLVQLIEMLKGETEDAIT